MKASQLVIAVISNKYSEYLEMAGEGSPVLLNEILAGLLHKEMEENRYYKKLSKNLQNELETLRYDQTRHKGMD